ncbi:MAG: hypothetical protein E7494_16150 [Ruminococcus albus]|nr:hypothetical protein [Ruminococcus albus]
MSYEIYRITARCKCPCGKGEIIRGDSMNDWNQTRSGDLEIHCPECSNKLKFTDGGLIYINYPDYSGDPNIKKQMSIIQDRIQNYKFKMTQDEKNDRLKAYLTAEEYAAVTVNPEAQSVRDFIHEMFNAEYFIEKYSFQELQAAQNEMKAKIYSTELTGKSLEIAEEHRRMCYSIKLSNVLKTINRAIRNYDAYQFFIKKRSFL